MDTPATPAEMQDYIVAQLLHGNTETEEQTAAKTLAKFAKQFGETIETCLQNKVFHEIQITGCATEKDEFQNFMETVDNNASVSLLCQNDGQAMATLRCDHELRAIISRLLFGGDIGNPTRSTDKPATGIEIGLQNIFADFLSQSLSTIAHLEGGDSGTYLAQEFDPEEVPGENVVICKYEIQTGPLKCNLEIAVCDTIVERVSSQSSADEETPTSTQNLELMQSKINAKVKLKPVSASLRHIQNLKVGDCIHLGSGRNIEGVFEVNGQPVYNCDIGRSGEIYCLKISERNDTQITVPQSQALAG